MLTDSNGARLSTINTNKPIAILFVSSCSTCIAQKVTELEKIQVLHPDIECLVVPMDADIPKVLNYKRFHNMQSRVIVDEKQELTNDCNPYFKPRVYLFDKHHKLKYIQSPNTSTIVAIKDIDSILSNNMTQKSGLYVKK